MCLPESQGQPTAILLLEDDPEVRALVAMMLQQHGYQVLTASTGAEGATISAAHPGRIDLLLVDVDLPPEGGPRAAAGVTALRPGAKILYYSGFPQANLVGEGILPRGAPFLVKPFLISELLAKVREVLIG